MAEHVSAEDALKKINRQLECSLCLTTYKEPKILPCFHVFCKSPCLEKLVSEDGQSLRCPTCKHLVPLSANGVSGLQSDFHISNLFDVRDMFNKVHPSTEKRCDNCEKHNALGYCHDCEQFLCDDCQTIHERVKVFKTHNIVTLNQLQADTINLVPPKKATPHCPKHSNKEVESYCETCCELICSKCTIRFHEDHKYHLIREVFAKRKEDIFSGLGPVREKLDTVQQALKAFDSAVIEIKEERVKVQADIYQEFDQLHSLLDQRKDQLVGMLELHTQRKLKKLEAQIDQAEIMQLKLTSCLEYAECGLETGTEEEVLVMKDPVLKRIVQINAEFDPDNYRPDTKAGIRFVTDSSKEQLQTACQQFAQIISDSDHIGSIDNTGGDDPVSPDNVGSIDNTGSDDPVSPDNSYVVQNTLKGVIISGEKASVECHTRTKTNKQFTKHQLSLIAMLVHLRSKERELCQVINQQNGAHKINYQPGRQGRYELHVTLEGIPVCGSPYNFIVVSSPRDMTKPVGTLQRLLIPCGIAISMQNGKIVVVEHQGNCISIHTQDGNLVRRFGTYGTEEGQLYNPWGVAISGKYCNFLSKAEQNSLKFVVNPNHNIYVSEKGNNRVQKFNAVGASVATVGSEGTKSSEFSSPAGICFNNHNKTVYVCDQGNHRIQVFSADLKYVATIGNSGTANGQFNGPRDIAVDVANNLYVTDYNNHRVQVFTADGRFLRAFTNKCNGEKLNYPSAIAIDSENTVFVSEDKLHCVSLFTSQGDYITSFGKQGTEGGQFNGIYGLSVDEKNVIVSDFSNGRLQIF